MLVFIGLGRFLLFQNCPFNGFNFSSASFPTGKAIFSLCGNFSCPTPFDLTATEGGDATFDTSISFVEGGALLQHQNVRELCLFPFGSNALYCCNPTARGCEPSDRVSVDLSPPQNCSQRILFTLRNVSLSDAGNYRVEMEADRISDGIDRRVINFQLFVVEGMFKI